MMNNNVPTITVSEELFDEMVNLLTELPYHQVVPVFQRMAEELSEPEQPQLEIVT